MCINVIAVKNLLLHQRSSTSLRCSMACYATNTLVISQGSIGCSRRRIRDGGRCWFVQRVRGFVAGTLLLFSRCTAQFRSPETTMATLGSQPILWNLLYSSTCCTLSGRKLWRCPTFVSEWNCSSAEGLRLENRIYSLPLQYCSKISPVLYELSLVALLEANKAALPSPHSLEKATLSKPTIPSTAGKL